MNGDEEHSRAGPLTASVSSRKHEAARSGPFFPCTRAPPGASLCVCSTRWFAACSLPPAYLDVSSLTSAALAQRASPSFCLRESEARMDAAGRAAPAPFLRRQGRWEIHRRSHGGPTEASAPHPPACPPGWRLPRPTVPPSLGRSVPRWMRARSTTHAPAAARCTASLRRSPTPTCSSRTLHAAMPLPRQEPDPPPVQLTPGRGGAERPDRAMPDLTERGDRPYVTRARRGPGSCAGHPSPPAARLARCTVVPGRTGVAAKRAGAGALSGRPRGPRGPA